MLHHSRSPQPRLCGDGVSWRVRNTEIATVPIHELMTYERTHMPRRVTCELRSWAGACSGTQLGAQLADDSNAAIVGLELGEGGDSGVEGEGLDSGLVKNVPEREVDGFCSGGREIDQTDDLFRGEPGDLVASSALVGTRS